MTAEVSQIPLVAQSPTKIASSPKESPVKRTNGTENGKHVAEGHTVLNDLPPSRMAQIFSFLDTKSIRSCLFVCTKWKDCILNSDDLWKSLTCKRWNVDPAALIRVSPKRSWKEVFAICEKSRRELIFEDSTEGIETLNKGKTSERSSHDGTFPRALTRKRVDNKEGALVQVRIDAPENWILNKMSIGITAKGSLPSATASAEFTAWSAIGLETESYGVGVDVLSFDQHAVCTFIEGVQETVKDVKFGVKDIVGFVIDSAESAIIFLKNGKVISEAKITKWPLHTFYIGASLSSFNKLTIIDQQEQPILFAPEEVAPSRKRKAPQFTLAGMNSSKSLSRSSRLRLMEDDEW